MSDSNPIRVLIWHEYRHEKVNPAVAAIYPDGMHNAIARYLATDASLVVETATLDEPGHGLSPERLANTDLLIWWGHMAHGEVADPVVDLVAGEVHRGMGAVFLHSAHFSKPFKKLMGTGCDLKWREADDREILWVTRPGHPLVDGIDDHIVLPAEEMYGEFFDIPEPEQTVMISSFSGGEVFRSLMTWTRGAGRVVYFRPGHETYPSYHHEGVLRVIRNACHWAALRGRVIQRFGRHDMGWVNGA
ncbi:ThuA domain-containing protein [Humisphaera borealis]|uniref:ThuA domain-containing protein n=1 Tax=Humisphaera borealis TaxID=2807512 RepID=A0A7M2X3B3_9BACT|nr:ThuA domain-containing protein [Humisphaera borealis]QOV92256.1 ThuA domain-containing protein [Humisphaera borealis]